MGLNILTYKERYSYGASYRVKTDKFLCTLMRDTDVIHFTEISRQEFLFKSLKMNARMMRAAEQEPKQESKNPKKRIRD